jgi:hypothetical protein
MNAKIIPLYVVCSPGRCVGKTLLSRLFIEFSALIGRSVAAFDLADEGPQLNDYLPQFTAIADIDSISGQMSLFERLVADNRSTRIIDVSYRSFQAFFTIAEKIEFFEEARRNAIQPLILFIIDADPKSRTAYASFRRRFMHESPVPVLNRVDASNFINRNSDSNAGTPAFLQIPLLSFALRALIDSPEFSFREFWQTTPASHTELRHWLENIFLQIQSLEHVRGGEGGSTTILPDAEKMGGDYRPAQGKARPPRYVSREVVTATSQHPNQVSYDVLKFPPKEIRREKISIDQYGEAVIGMLQSASHQLQADKERIDDLEAQIEHIRQRAKTWLQLLAKEVSQKR